MYNKEIRNAKITGTTLGREDSETLSFSIHLDYGGVAQSFGNYRIDDIACGTSLILCILQCLGVRSWEKLGGTYCRVESSNSKVHRIGHILQDKWIDPTQFITDESYRRNLIKSFETEYNG